MDYRNNFSYLISWLYQAPQARMTNHPNNRKATPPPESKPGWGYNIFSAALQECPTIL
ncbi:MAG: hypothetical protein ANABAC_0163 [Anaerolineae bacterium]|nr:MAG: hypothetical protein ANABAC_0163 [Anaerolineae bacterium]